MIQSQRERERESGQNMNKRVLSIVVLCQKFSVFLIRFSFISFIIITLVCVCVDLKMLQFQIPMLSTERIEQKHVSLTT